MAQIDKPNLHFNTKLFTGNGSGGNYQAITGVGFQPDLVVLKNRTDSAGTRFFDAVRGAGKVIYSNDSGAEESPSNMLTAFSTDGFTVGDDNGCNGNGDSIVSWNWKAGGGAGSSNTDGTINTTSTSVNTTAGISISKYTGNATNSTVGHGLGVAPDVVIVKNLISSGGSGEHWRVQHHKVAATKVLYLNRNVAQDTNGDFQSTFPTNSVFSISSADGCNKNGEANVAYCFVEKKGFSKFGSYTGNNNASDGTFVYTGFKPAWIMIKPYDYADNWHIIDVKRNPINTMAKHLFANLGNAENTSTAYNTDFLSNGFKAYNTNSALNGSYNYIYMAFAENPIVGSNNIPAVAR
tara:strand:+ start:1679 stop:2731 length:1053 start_codon:yes stop_codon:yes gene_type:complete